MLLEWIRKATSELYVRNRHAFKRSEIMVRRGEQAAAVAEWAVAVAPAPGGLDLRARVAPVLSTVSCDAGVSKFFEALAARDPPVKTVDEVKLVPGPQVKAAARGVIATATLKSFARLIDPAGFDWPPGEPVAGRKRKPGGNGNNRRRIELASQLEAEGVEALDAATFRWGARVFDGVPKKGEATKLNGSERILFDNTFLAMGKVCVRHACARSHRRSCLRTAVLPRVCPAFA